MNDIEIPDWFTEKFLENILLGSNNTVENIKIIKYDITRCVPKGNNYLSNILRVNIEYQKIIDSGHSEINEISLVIKVPLKDEALSALTRTGIVEREVQVYYDLIPKLNEIFLKANENFLSPICYKCDVEGVIIMEDLLTFGYKMVDKQEQMDYKHGVAVIKNLARFHAASARLHELDPELVEKVGRHLLLIPNMDPDVKSILEPVQGVKHMEMLCTEFDKYPETKKYVPFLSKLAPKLWDYLLPALDCYDQEFAALNHADAYTNNIFFNYNQNSEISDVKFVDFQMLRYTCPVMELIYFIHSSIKFEVIAESYEELTHIYLNNLNSCLKKYGSSKRWKEDDFKKSLERREIFTLITCIVVLPFMFGGSKDFSDTCELPEYPYFEYSQSEKFRSTCVKFLEKYSEKSWFKNL